MWLIVVLFTLTLLYYVIYLPLNFWKKHGVPGPQPIPFVGNIGASLTGSKSVNGIVTDIYKEYEGYPFVGIYRGYLPILIARDPDFIKNIIVKDFKSFHDNTLQVDKKIDPLFGRNPFVLNGEEWKKSRSQLTPCFTAGKMKYIFPLVDEVSKKMVKFMEDEIEAKSSAGIELIELCTKFTVDDVAACAFGIEGKSFEDPKAEFRKLVQTFLSPGTLEAIKFIMLLFIPKLKNVMPIKFVRKDVEDKLTDLVKGTMKLREENNIVSNDFLAFIINLSKNSPDVTDVDVVAHATSFFLDGVVTSSQVMSFLLFNLAMNPEAQERLRDEINDSFETNNEFNYETIQSMTFLDACLNESLRQYPPLAIFDKLCTQKYTYTCTNPDYKHMSVTVEPGTSIVIPVEGLHMDPKYFPSPEKFMPERFLEKDEIKKYTFLPFGEGPRACLGQRFGSMQVKLGTVYLVKNFELKVNQKTKLPLEMDPWNFLLFPKDGLWLDFTKIGV